MKGSTQEIILILGLLLSSGILLLQLRNYFIFQQKIAQGDILYSFSSDLYNIINNVKVSHGNFYINYQPLLYKYELIAKENNIEIRDKISGKNSSFSLNFNIDSTYISDSKKICIIKIIDCDGKENIQIKKDFCDEINSDCIKYDYSTEPEFSDLNQKCPSKEYSIQKIVDEAKKEGVKPSLALAIAYIESSLYHCDNNGNVKISPSGAIGLMQLMPNECSNPYDVNENIKCGIRQLKEKCRTSSAIAVYVGFTCTKQASCEDPDVECIYDCSNYGDEVKKYSGWDLAVRAYNGWSCCVNLGGNIDCYGDWAQSTRKYVELVNNAAQSYKIYD
ncbi:MAG: lytic transglycosylase domain-containing protein [Candidatus Aenigmatarchaeota archaeon]|nr:lytic transglycosylase domain-containing protein [Candidatus Aenigmarchaeota archaeon]